MRRVSSLWGDERKEPFKNYVNFMWLFDDNK